jgi:alpha-mannosidase
MSLDRRAEELQTPAEYVVDSAHEGQESWERSFLEIQPSSVWILAVKRAEGESDGTIVRLQERSGISTNASLKSSILGLDHSISLRPWELKTVLIRKSADGKAELREVSLLEI